MEKNEMKENTNARNKGRAFRGILEKTISPETRAKFPLLDKLIPLTNYIVCGLIVVIVVAMIANSGSSSSGGRATSASDFNYELTADGRGIKINRYTGNGGKVVIPSTIENYPVTEIGAGAFMGQNDSSYFPANDISEIVIPNSVAIIGYGAFFWNDNLRAVTLPNGLKILSQNAFRACVNLTTVNLPTSLEQIRPDAFYGCGELMNLIIPSSLTSVRFTAGSDDYIIDSPANNSFRGCQKLPIKTRQTIQGWGYTSGF